MTIQTSLDTDRRLCSKTFHDTIFTEYVFTFYQFNWIIHFRQTNNTISLVNWRSIVSKDDQVPSRLFLFVTFHIMKILSRCYKWHLLLEQRSVPRHQLQNQTLQSHTIKTSMTHQRAVNRYTHGEWIPQHKWRQMFQNICVVYISFFGMCVLQVFLSIFHQSKALCMGVYMCFIHIVWFWCCVWIILSKCVMIT
jgi:hypothetical protein